MLYFRFQSRFSDDLKAWEQKMVAVNRQDLLRVNALRDKKPKDKESKAQELGCSESNQNSIIKSKSSNQTNIEYKSAKPKVIKEIRNKDTNITETSEIRSTGDQFDHRAIQENANKNELKYEKHENKNDKTIISSIKNFFKLQCYTMDIHTLQIVERRVKVNFVRV